MHAAEYWTAQGERLLCGLCPHACRIAEGGYGICGVRRADGGALWAEAYGRVSSLAMDPIEKKPLYHVKPGTKILSLGSTGCNMRCSFCQNWSISQAKPDLFDFSPAQAARQAKERGACGVAYTYNEPLINYEYVRDCARDVRKQGLLNVVVTNGYIQPEPLQALLPWIDAWNIDVKSMRQDFYRDVCGGSRDPVLETVRRAAEQSHVEVTHLVVTGGNDSLGQINELVDWLAGLPREIPVHFTRYYPQYRMDADPTDPAFLESAAALARKRLPWVYVGNLGAGHESVTCPDCQTVLVARRGYRVAALTVEQGRCPKCQRAVPGIF